MPLRRKPGTAAPDVAARGDASVVSADGRIDELIDKGGTVAVDTPAPVDAKPNSLQIRLDLDLIARIDRARRRRTLAPSRMSWILEALLEKLARERAR